MAPYVHKKVWSTVHLWYCTTQVLHLITPWALKGKSNSSFLAKAQSFSLRNIIQISKERGLIVNSYRCFSFAEMKHSGTKRQEDQPYFCQKHPCICSPYKHLKKMSVLIVMKRERELHNHCKNVPLVDKADYLCNKRSNHSGSWGNEVAFLHFSKKKNKKSVSVN